MDLKQNVLFIFYLINFSKPWSVFQLIVQFNFNSDSVPNE